MPGPYLKAAFLCERIIEEADKTASAIRIVDRLTIQSEPGIAPTPPYPIELRIFISVVAGDPDGYGEHTITLSGHSPSGKEFFLPAKTPAILTAVPESTFNLRGRLLLETSEEGVHWFHIEIDDRLAMRLPLTIEVKR